MVRGAALFELPVNYFALCIGFRKYNSRKNNPKVRMKPVAIP
jgi:hypothetical protein